MKNGEPSLTGSKQINQPQFTLFLILITLPKAISIEGLQCVI